MYAYRLLRDDEWKAANLKAITPNSERIILSYEFNLSKGPCDVRSRYIAAWCGPSGMDRLKEFTHQQNRIKPWKARVAKTEYSQITGISENLLETCD